MANESGFVPYIPLLTGIAGAAIAWSVYRLSVAQRQDAWLRTLWDFHRAFWQDEKMEDVRAWIANDNAYAQVRPILVKRLEALNATNLEERVTVEEYKVLEKLDRFAALLLGYKRISPRDNLLHKQTRFRLYDAYWINGITTERRPEMRAYLKRFFSELLSAD